jgi:hypothetical protein
LNFFISKGMVCQCRWLTPVILATQEAEIRRIMVRSQPWTNRSRDLILKKTHHKKKKAGGVAQVAEHLPSKCEALIQIPEPVNKRGLG